uniref:Shikimate kinase n=1 Tax=candidate division WOR-3 bacterium TaxID=2052148 RepID=A0A7V0Z7D2_UNCW3
MSENIVLIGFMGTGKDTIGRILAKRLNLAYLSTDRMIELAEQRSIKEIFQSKGEEYFRKRERWVLERIKGLKNVVIATGGGIVIDKKNRELLKRTGKVIQLYANQETLLKRIEMDGSRPLVKSKKEFFNLLGQRKGIYDFAEMKIDTTEKAPELVAREIIKRLGLEKIDYPGQNKSIIIHTKSRVYPVIITFYPNRHLCFKKKKIFIITNPLVGVLYLDDLVENLKRQENEVNYLIIPDGEGYKSFKTVERIYEYLFKINFQRKDIILGLGGGAITDIAGFVASTFKRGCRLVYVPTTLLCQVDAALGGKNGVNTKYGKNMFGTFYQPELVVCDIKKIMTLPDREFSNGIAEVIKYGIIGSEGLFRFLNEKKGLIMERNPSVLFRIIKECVMIKGKIIEEDENEEKGIREVLNFGHTIGHIIEKLGGYKRFSHGEAVSIGMVQEIGIFNKNRNSVEVIELLRGYSLPVELPEFNKKQDIKRFILQDKKMKGEKIRIPIFERIGRVKIKEVLCKRFF